MGPEVEDGTQNDNPHSRTMTLGMWPDFSPRKMGQCKYFIPPKASNMFKSIKTQLNQLSSEGAFFSLCLPVSLSISLSPSHKNVNSM